MNTTYQKFIDVIKKDWYASFLFVFLVAFSVFSVQTLRPEVAGDSVSYVESIAVLRGGDIPPEFTANRIVTTYGALNIISFFDMARGDVASTWLFINILLYVGIGMFFYFLVFKIIENKKIAFLSSFLLMTNYAMVSSGLAYMMDIGGWFFYVASIYYSYKYLQEEKIQWLVITTSLVAFGGLWKEYSFLAYIVVTGVIVYIHRTSIKKILILLLSTGLVVATPIVLVNVYSFLTYQYTYLSWLAHQEGLYPGQNILVEYIKSFGSLYNAGWFFIIGGIVFFAQNIKSVFVDKKLFFVALVIISALLVFVWPVVTRVLFITAPALILLSSFYMKKIEHRWFILYPVLILSAICGHFMDSFILDFVNLPF